MTHGSSKKNRLDALEWSSEDEPDSGSKESPTSYRNSRRESPSAAARETVRDSTSKKSIIDSDEENSFQLHPVSAVASTTTSLSHAEIGKSRGKKKTKSASRKIRPVVISSDESDEENCKADVPTCRTPSVSTHRREDDKENDRDDKLPTPTFPRIRPKSLEDATNYRAGTSKFALESSWEHVISNTLFFIRTKFIRTLSFKS